MKKIIIAVAALVAFASCTKQTTYLCKITTYTPRGIVAGPQKRTVAYTGSYTEMKAFEVANTWGDSTNIQGDAPEGAWQVCHCR